VTTQIPEHALRYFRRRVANDLLGAILSEMAAQGLTREDVARRLGIPEAAAWPHGNDDPTLEQVSDLLLALGCELSMKVTKVPKNLAVLEGTLDNESLDSERGRLFQSRAYVLEAQEYYFSDLENFRTMRKSGAIA
jgi:transcriptional regulator with XRE-family HTH domain